MSAAVDTAAGASEASSAVVSTSPIVRTALPAGADVNPLVDTQSPGSESFSPCPAVPGWKRWFDTTCVILSLPLTLPLMLLVAVWVRLVSRGPALFRQERIGRNGRRFVIYKFRSMKLDAPRGVHRRHFRHLVRTNSPMVKLDVLCDKRLIPGGCFLRASGLDELPQLFNVLRGEMSLVGPRPCLPDEMPYFSRPQRRRFDALPGLTGIWQVNGKGLSTFTEMNAMDVWYVRRVSLRMDVGVMLRTPAVLLKQMRDAAKQRITNREPAASEAESVSDAGFPGIG